MTARPVDGSRWGVAASWHSSLESAISRPRSTTARSDIASARAASAPAVYRAAAPTINPTHVCHVCQHCMARPAAFSQYPAFASSQGTLPSPTHSTARSQFSHQSAGAAVWRWLHGSGPHAAMGSGCTLTG